MSKADEIRQDIEETRCEMDQTLDEVEEKIQPRHLLDEVLELFQSDSSRNGATQDKVREVGKSVVRKVKEHPVPALLCGAGLAWLALETFTEEEDENVSRYQDWRNLPEHSGSYVDAATGEPYPGRYTAYAAWEEDYDWSDDDENAWRTKAKKKIEDIRKTLSDTAKPFSEKLSASAFHIHSLRGGNYDKARGEWRDLPEYSGSFVDARTGEPYDDSYGELFHPADDLDYLSDYEWSEEDEQTWKEKAQEALDSMESTLSNAKQSMQQRIKSLASHLSGFAGHMQGRASNAGHRIRDGARHAGKATQDYARQAKKSTAKAARQTQEQISYAMEEYPLAVGAACLGLGLAAGLLLPSTKQEDRWMGEASDDLKHRAEETAHEVAERGKHIAEETGKAAKQEAKRQGLTPKQLAKRGEKVAKTASEEASHLGEKAEKVADRAAKTAKSRTKQEVESASS